MIAIRRSPTIATMRRAIVAAMLVALSGETGCAWLFQDRLHGGLSGYRGDSEPHCSTSEGWALVDGAFAGLNIIGVLEASSDDTIANRDAIMTGGVLWTVVHLASAITGFTWASSCRKAYKQWNEESGGAGISAREKQERRRVAIELSGNPQNDPRLARTFWCARSGACFAEQVACGDSCSRRTTAWCAGGERGFVCAETRDGCLSARDARRDRSGGECVERRAERSNVRINPANDPAVALAYWCSERDRVCSADELACEGICHKTDEVWCVRYRESDGASFLCGMNEDVCRALASNPRHRRNRAEMGPCKPEHVRRGAEKPAPPAAAANPITPAPRGFFCSSSAATPAAGFCTREKADCQRARDAALAAVADLDECKLVETAFCYIAGGTERCTPTMETCVERTQSALDVTAACDERK